MKILKRTIISVIIIVAIVYALPALLLQIPYFQEKTSHQIADYLTKKLQTEVHIQQIKYGFFNTLILKDVYLEDLSGDVLFKAKRIAAGFEIFPLLQKKWRFNSIQLFTFQFNMSKASDDSPLNIQYIIDAFSKGDTITTPPVIDLRIKTFSLRSGRFSYRVKDKAETPGIFNLNNLLLNDISSKIQIRYLSKNELELQLDKLSFTEQSGFRMNNLTFDLIANEQTAKINRLEIELDKSVFIFTDINANYDLSTITEKEKTPAGFEFKAKTSTICPQELSAIIPVFSKFEDRISFEGDFSGTANDLSVKNLFFRYYNQIMISANIDMQNIFQSNGEKFYIKGNISNSFFSPDGIERIINNISLRPVELPMQVKQMKNIGFEGNVSGTYNDLTASGALHTNIGTIQTNLKLGKDEARYIKGQISSDSLNLEKLLNNKDYGEMAFDIRLEAKQNNDQKFSGVIDASLPMLVYKGYTYQNLNLNGDFSPESFNGRFILNSPDGKISGEGLWVFKGKESLFDFQAKVSGLKLDKLNLTNRYKQPVLSFDLNVDLKGNNPDNLTGDVLVNNLQFETEKGSYFLDSLTISSTLSGFEKHIRIQSEIVSGDIWGHYSFKTIMPALKQTFTSYFPSLVKPELKYSGKGENDFSVNLTIAALTDFSKVFELPFSLQGQTDISGKYSESELQLKFSSDRVAFGSVKTDSLRFVFTGLDKEARADLSGISVQRRNSRVKFNIQSDAANDRMNTFFKWCNEASNYKGDLKLTAQFSKNDYRSPVRIETNIEKTNMIFNDSIWTLNPASVVIDSANIRINHLHAFHRDQFLKIDGALSHQPEQELQVDLNRVDLKYIFQSLSIPALEFGGMATGFVNVQDVFKTRKLETNLNISDFAFNNVNFGHLNLTGTWDDENQGVVMIGKTIKNDTAFVDVNGIIYPVKQELSINFDAKNADARFLRKYLDKVVQDLTGNLSGHLRLFGNLNKPTIEGDVFAKNCRFGINYLNTFYSFTDSVKCLPDTIKANYITIYDEKGNKAIANGFVKHHLFNDFYYSATISYSNFMVFNTTKSLNSMFYGTAFGNGTASIYGTEDVVNIDASVQNTGNTKMTLNFMEEPDIEDYDFIRFVSVKNPSAETGKKQKTVSQPSLSANPGPEIRINLLLDVNPQATIDMIMDPISSDKISGYGRGNIQIQYGTKIPLKVLGNFEIEHGKYNFTLHQFFLRNFDIQEGSSIAFRGNPYVAELNLKTKYTVNANLEDLDPRLIENKSSARNNVPVSCILMLTGPLDRPSIAFDLDLPGATEELVRQVKSYIRTDDMMNRQMAYLLVLSRFYTPPENMRDNAAMANSSWSYLTSTLSTQISNILGLMSNNIRVGTIFNQSTAGAQTATELELLLSGQLLNNRLIVNGNFGYSNNPYTGTRNNIPLIGDFDLEYKLTKSGDIRLKGFNRYNYRNYYSITPEMTQGIGILFRKDFDHWLNLTGKKNDVK